ncbi:MAG: T9SS type A sorting domain-containing protein [Saprospiraceae bacterium]|nr:T9SS type A sorting domain-containing protein [Saprospiraceae bacterium]
MKKITFLLIFSVLASIPLIAESTTHERRSKEMASSLVTADFTIEINCTDGNWSATATATNPATTNHVWYLYATTVAGATTGGTLVSTITGGLSATFGWLDLSRHYYIRHYSEAPDLAVETRLAVPDFSANASLTYILKDKDGVVKDNFCFGEDIFLDPSGTSNYDRYFISVLRRPSGSNANFELYADYGWTYSNNIETLNLSRLVRTSGENPGEIFEPGYVYELQFAIANPPNCIPWIEMKREFRVECCEDFLSADFVLDMVEGTQGLILRANDFNTYSNVGITHTWTVLSSPNPSGGPYSYVRRIQTTSAAGPITLYHKGVAGTYYFVIHQISTPCGDICYGVRKKGFHFHTGMEPDGGEEVNDCQMCGEIDCNILDGRCFAPGDIRAYAYRPLSVEIFWNWVPGALEYVVEVTLNDPNCCNNGEEIQSWTFYTTLHHQLLGAILERCASWRVGSVCEGEIVWSELICHHNPFELTTPNGEGDLVVDDLGLPGAEPQVYPNPANTELNVLLPKGENPELIRMLDLHGRAVFEQQHPDQQLEIDCKALPAGLYTIQVRYSNNRQTVHKVQISH